MSYPEELRNYQGPWPPPKGFLRTEEETALAWRAWQIRKGGLNLGKVLVIATLIGVLLPDTNVHRVPILATVFHVLGRLFPMIQAVGYYSHESLGDVAGVSVLIVGILSAMPDTMRTMLRIQTLEGYSPLLRFIHTGNAPRSRWSYVTGIMMLLGAMAPFVAWIAWSDIRGYWALYVQGTSAIALWTQPGALGALTGNGLNSLHGAGVSFYLFLVLRYRYGFPLFAVFYGGWLAGAVVGNVLIVSFLWRFPRLACAMREDWQVLMRTTSCKKAEN